MAAAFAVEDSVKYLHNQGADVILFVNVLGHNQLLGADELLAEYQSAILWQELRRKLNSFSGERVVRVEVKAPKINLYDFEERNSLVLAGERAGQEAVDKLIKEYGF